MNQEKKEEKMLETRIFLKIEGFESSPLKTFDNTIHH